MRIYHLEVLRDTWNFTAQGVSAGWAIFRAEQDDNIPLGQLLLGRKLKDTMNAPSRMKNLRIAHRPGSFDFVIELMPYSVADMLVTGRHGALRRIQVNIPQDQLTPIRIDFTQETHRTFVWDVKQGHPIPLNSDPSTLQFLTSALNDSDWETRWVATRVLRDISGDIPQPALARLNELSRPDEYQRCLGTTSVDEFSELREEAAKTLKRFEKATP